MVRYLVDHPDAKDTDKGIAEWWRPESDAVWAASDVRAALDFLSARCWVTVRNVGEGVRLYSINTGHLAEMEAFPADIQHRLDSNEEE